MQWILYIYVLKCVLCIKACQKQITDNLNLLETYLWKNTISSTVNLSLRKKNILDVLKKKNFDGQKEHQSNLRH